MVALRAVGEVLHGCRPMSAMEGRNDHVHLQITMQGGRMNGQGVSAFAIDPTELFDWDQPERNREGGDLLP